MTRALLLALRFLCPLLPLCCTVASLPNSSVGADAEVPPLALGARIEGEVAVSFVLDDKGEVASVDVKSGHPMLKEATATIVRSWKFELPKNLFRTDWKYDTTFRYHLSGREVASNETAKLTIVVDSFHRIDVMSDAYKPIMQTSY